VAKGAALLASPISVSEEAKEEARGKTKLQLVIKHEVTTAELEEMINIRVLKDKTEGVFPDKIYAEAVRFDGAWSSGKKQIGERPVIVDLLLAEGCSNSFEINVYDEAGNKLECEPKQFSILQGIGELESQDFLLPAKGLEKSKKAPSAGIANTTIR